MNEIHNTIKKLSWCLQSPLRIWWEPSVPLVSAVGHIDHFHLELRGDSMADSFSTLLAPGAATWRICQRAIPQSVRLHESCSQQRYNKSLQCREMHQYIYFLQKLNEEKNEIIHFNGMPHVKASRYTFPKEVDAFLMPFRTHSVAHRWSMTGNSIEASSSGRNRCAGYVRVSRSICCTN